MAMFQVSMRKLVVDMNVCLCKEAKHEQVGEVGWF